MSRRFLSSMGALAVVVAVMSLVASGQGAQAPTAAAKAKAPAKTTAESRAAAKPYAVPHTSWGDPDLQGIWNNATSTPLQRPERFGDKAVLAEDEAEQVEEELAKTQNRDNRAGGPEAQVIAGYNEFWMDARRLELLKDRRTSLIVDPPDGRMPPRLPPTPEVAKIRAARAEAQARVNAGLPNDPEDFSVDVRCITRNDRPPHLSALYNNDFQIYQSPGYVAIQSEMIHSARIVPLDGRPHLANAIRQWQGDTRGHWEGATLVLETTNFRKEEGATYQNANPDSLMIVERFTRVDAGRIDYEFTISDPATWARPWTAMIPWKKADGEIYEYGCREGDLDIFHLLQMARKRDKGGDN
jgi:hypothetical protein